MKSCVGSWTSYCLDLTSIERGFHVLLKWDLEFLIIREVVKCNRSQRDQVWHYKLAWVITIRMSEILHWNLCEGRLLKSNPHSGLFSIFSERLQAPMLINLSWMPFVISVMFVDRLLSILSKYGHYFTQIWSSLHGTSRVFYHKSITV